MGKGKDTLLFLGEDGSPDLWHGHHCHREVKGGGVSCYSPGRRKDLAPFWAFSGTTSAEGREQRHLLTVWQWWKSRHSTWPLLLVMGDRAAVFSVVFGLSRAIVIWKFSVSLECPFPRPLARESGIFLRQFLSAPFGISGLPASLAPGLGYMRLKENPVNSLPYHFLVSGSVASQPSLHLSESSYVSYIISRGFFLVVFSRKNR